jgi:hypothetical protein
MKRVILSVLIAMALSACAAADSITFTLDPASGNVKGDAGSVVGWGFTFTNTTSNWVVLDRSSFTGSAVDGTYVDYLISAFYIVGPSPESSTLQQSWNPSALLGVGEFDIKPTAAPGTVIPGNIVVDYSVFSVDPNDPNFNPDTDTVIADATLSAPAMISVPEPSFLTLLISALFLPLTYKGWRRCIAVRRPALTA